MSYLFSFDIPMRLPGLNEYIGLINSNRFKGSAAKKQIESDISWFMKKHKITRPCIIRFIWHEADRRRDKDNVAFAKKFILDAMQKSGMLENDNNQYIAGFRDDFEYGSKCYVRVEVYDAE